MRDVIIKYFPVSSWIIESIFQTIGKICFISNLTMNYRGMKIERTILSNKNWILTTWRVLIINIPLFC